MLKERDRHTNFSFFISLTVWPVTCKSCLKMNHSVHIHLLNCHCQYQYKKEIGFGSKSSQRKKKIKTSAKRLGDHCTSLFVNYLRNRFQSPYFLQHSRNALRALGICLSRTRETRGTFFTRTALRFSLLLLCCRE